MNCFSPASAGEFTGHGGPVFSLLNLQPVLDRSLHRPPPGYQAHREGKPKPCPQRAVHSQRERRAQDVARCPEQE